jgi:DNA modification methylase
VNHTKTKLTGDRKRTPKRPKGQRARSCPGKVANRGPTRPGAAHEFDPSVAWRRVDELRPYARNARTHSDKQIDQIAARIQEFGFTNPVLIDADGRIIAGHGRVAAAKRLGLEVVPTIRLDHLTEAQIRAYVIADNRLAELAGWDDELLAVELQYLSEIEVDFDVGIMGFVTAEIDLMISSLDAGEEEPDPADEVPEIDEHVPAVTQPDDLWTLGAHRLLCADALKPESHERLMDGAKARMGFTDPPYNVPVDGHVCGLGRIKHREFAMAAGEMSKAEFTAFLHTALTNLAGCCADGALIYVCMDWRHLHELLTAAQGADLELVNVCVWNKDNGGMGSFYRSKHELVCVFKAGDAPHVNNIQLGRFGRYRTNVWDYPGVNTLRRGRLEELAMHPTVKPVAMVADAIKDCTRRRDIVLDAFAGSGTTLIAAERAGRIGYGLELDPVYVDTAVRRWEQLTREKAVHVETGLTIEALAEARGVRASEQLDRNIGDSAATAAGEVSDDV